ncbi:hypothetical protein BC834DRAFT_997210 [Gloeopeniophorella convolvens]|nr:hypothetical protein BC834DRAFT_997210 [Gloeopeniophorella convolvens]
MTTHSHKSSPHEAHSSALKLQRHSLEATLAIERAQALEHETAAARTELAALRAHPDTTPRPAELQLPELTLALRRASDKLTLAEDALRARSAQLADARAAAARAQHAAGGAFALAAASRAREEEAHERERALARRLRVAAGERTMAERALREYADLVRALERRQSLPSSPPASARSANGKAPEGGAAQEERAALAEEFGGAEEALHAEAARLQALLDETRAELEAGQKVAEEERAQLVAARAELERLQHDDSAAAKMVSRYMKFSQSTTDTLQRALEAAKARHAATAATLHTQLRAAQDALAAEQRQAARVRDALDEATEQLAREAYGRRREIALRLAVVGREDQLAEALRRWVRRAREMRARGDVSAEQRLDALVGDAGALLALVDGGGGAEEVHEAGVGSVARILAAQDAVKTLVEELQGETERRVRLERVLGRAEVDEDGRVVLPPSPPSPPAVEPVPPVLKVDAATSPIPSPSTPTSPEVGEQPPLPPAESLGVSPLPQLTPLEDEVESLASPPLEDESAATVIHQPAPRSAVESPTFLSQHPSPSSSVSPQASPSTSPTVQDTTLFTKPSSPPTSAIERNTPPPEPSPPSSPVTTLLAELAQTKTRYDALQRAFRDCHLALRELSQTIPTLPTSPTLPTAALQTVLARLDDFNEDARVELEIRIADEERIARGYTTLLTVPGALARPTDAAAAHAAARAFVAGSDPSVARALAQFARKRADLEHDVAALKRTAHEPPSAPPSPSPSPAVHLGTHAGASASWTSLAAGLFAARPASPAPTAAATFGAVVTAPRVRRVPSGEGAGVGGGVAALLQELRIPMPELAQHAAPAAPVRPAPRARTTSGMYMLGLGMRGGGLAPRMPSGLGAAHARAHAGGDSESDVE